VRIATPFNVSLLVPETDEMLTLGTYVQAQLEDCGLAVELEAMPVDSLAEPWPSGPVFGRNFDMVIWSWPEWLSPLCEMFASWEIPSNQQPFGINATGYASSEYDEACKEVFLSFPSMSEYQEALAESQRIFNDGLPALPLYQAERWLVSDTDLCGLRVDALATSSLWNVEMLDSGGSCP
jgi:peptide/nickel transport system substrate-binding protein